MLDQCSPALQNGFRLNRYLFQESRLSVEISSKLESKVVLTMALRYCIFLCGETVEQGRRGMAVVLASLARFKRCARGTTPLAKFVSSPN